MYFRILKKDLKRKKTMNIILFVFIILATTFVTSSVNNIAAINNGCDYFLKLAGAPEYCLLMSGGETQWEVLEDFCKKEKMDVQAETLIIAGTECYLNGEKLENGQIITVSSPEQSIMTIFNSENQPIEAVEDGEIFIPQCFMSLYDIAAGDRLQLTFGDEKREFVVAGGSKDALFHSNTVGLTKCLISETDYQSLQKEKDVQNRMKMYDIETKESTEELEDMLASELSSFVYFSADSGGIREAYLMDMVMAGMLLVVSMCLILISLMILMFTIRFTVNEEYREIGVMKAIGIKNHKIRGLYIIKYFVLSLLGGIIGVGLSLPFGAMLLEEVSENMIINTSGNMFINVVSYVAVVGIIIMFSYISTWNIKRFSPVDAIRSGATGERFRRKGVFRLNRWHMRPVGFLAWNDIASELRKFAIMIIIFTIGILLMILPLNSINTLKSDKLIAWFSMVESDICMTQSGILDASSMESRKSVEAELTDIKQKLAEQDIPVDAWKEIGVYTGVTNDEKTMIVVGYQGIGDITTEQYTYLEGTAPLLENEVAVTHTVAEKLDIEIGDEISIKIGDESEDYIVTATYQTMTNMGNGVRFSGVKQLDFQYVAGGLATQIMYTDEPDAKEQEARLEKIKELYPEATVEHPGEYISRMIGDIAGQLEGIKYMILLVISFINILITVLMVKIFITKEHSQIAMLKAIGFSNHSLVLWQTIRIGIILVISVILGTLLSTPISHISVGKVFQMMGAASIEFEIIPLEVYVLYPLLLFGITLLAAFITAQGVRGISTTEISNME